MKIGLVDYGPIWASSGTLGFFGEGYSYHIIVPSLHGLTFVAKTVTVEAHKGNMPLNPDTWRPVQFKPSCIKVNLIKGIAINAVGLSNFGIKAALATGRWQTRTKPFMLSFMPISQKREGRMAEAREFVKIMLPALSSFKGKVALQVNLSCPNTGENLNELEQEALEILLILSELNIPLIPKFNVMTAPHTVARLASEVAIGGVCISNTIPYGKLADKIVWEDMFGEESPLKALGGGGLSGKPLFPLVLAWVTQARQFGLTLPINAGGGIMHSGDVVELFEAGANSVSVASVVMLRPWNLPSIVAAAHEYYDAT